MKFSESWLREWVDPEIDTGELVEQLTMAGLEVDGTEAAAGEFTGVVVGEIVALEPHPNADKLNVCRVADGGKEPLQVVCGAPNARVGLKAPFARVGAELPGDFKIRKAKLRDVESRGMLCSEQELAVSEEASGLWELPEGAPVGADLRDYLKLDDTAIEIDLTPNRGDCLGMRGLAREVGVLNRANVTEPSLAPVPAQIEATFPVELEAGDKCPRYAGRVIRNVDIVRPSPKWLVERLRRSGLRSIDPVVDVTNYVMLELGQPMHAFDLDKLSGGIRVREAAAGEKIHLLDGSEQELQEGTLVIADDSGAIAMAGIMGGGNTAVTGATRHIFLESAFFSPLAIAGRARAYGMHTDSSHRFERGVDSELQVPAMERATALLLDITGGEPGPVVHAQLPELLPQPARIRLHRSRVEQQLAVALADNDIEDMLTRLGLEMIEQDEQGWCLRAPSWRFDLTIEADLIEEIARIHGYNRIPNATLSSPLQIRPENEALVSLADLRRQLIARGYVEAINYSFVDPEVQKLLDPETAPVPLVNPIASDMAVMRTTLWAGLLKACKHNLHRQQQRVRLFETGLRFRAGDTLAQEGVIAGVITGPRYPEAWSNDRAKVDFYDIKGDVESLIDLTGVADCFRWAVDDHPALHPGQCAKLTRADCEVGHIGRLHPSVAAALDIDQEVFLFELKLDQLRNARLPEFTALSRFPEVRRDIAVVVDREVTAQDLESTVRQNAGECLVDLKIFDVYQGEGIENNRKSVALGLTFQHSSRTLNEQEINIAMGNVINALEQRLSASLRG